MGENEIEFFLPPAGSGTRGKAKRIGNLKNLLLMGLSAVLLFGSACQAPAQVQRLLGIDVSAWQGSLSQTTWNNLRTVDNRQFAIIRSSRGGTSGYYNQNDSSNANGKNTLSQRYDDPYYIQNINRATAAGIFAGSYHFSRPDIIETTLNAGGLRNNGADEADHFIQMAGPWMRPGYLVPVHDLEAGDGVRTDAEMAQFCIDFSTRIYEARGIRPAIYINGNYAANILGGASAALRDALAKPAALLPSVVSPAYPTLWSARWVNQTNPSSINVQTGEPLDSYLPIYGPWDDYGATHPWQFWQYASTARLPSYSTAKNIDVDVVRGGLEFLKDQLVPAVWMPNNSGDWSTLTNWNSGQTPVGPAPGPGQVTPVATTPLPTPRLPGAAGTGVNSGQHDTVILERPSANVTVTIASGTHNIRKLYMRETLNLTGGSLTINHAPAPDSTTNGAQFSGPVTLSGSGSLQVHTLQVDTTRVFTLAGGSLRFDTINLMPHSTTPAKILVTGDVNLNSLSNATAVIATGLGSGGAGSIDLTAGTRVLTIGNGTADIDLSVKVPIGNGALVKAGAGTMLLNAAGPYNLATTISAGRLMVNNTTNSATGTGSVTVNRGGILAGNGRIAGPVTVNGEGTMAPGTTASLGTLTLNTEPSFSGTNFLRINRNSGSPLADKIALTSGTLTYGGSLVVSNVGATLTGGEQFTLFAAGAYSGAFAATNLPGLSGNLNWHLGNLTANGSIKVNRQPVANGITLTNTPGQVLQIPVAGLVGGTSDADGDVVTLAGFDATSTNGIPVSSGNTFLYYHNNANLPDRFNYTVSDGAGGTAIAVAQIVPGLVVLPDILAQPQSQTNLAGTDATFSVTATGTAPLAYQWRFNGADITTASDRSYTRAAAQNADAGGYSVVVSNIAGAVTSSTAGLTITQPIPARIESLSVLPGGRFHFTVSGSPGHYAIDATTNLSTWDELTNFVTTSDSFEFTDGDTNLTRRGYRTRLLSNP